MLVLLSSTEDSVRDSLRDLTPIAIGWVIAAVVVIAVLATLRDKIANIIREPGLLVGGAVAFGIVTFVAFLIGATIALALAIGAGAGVVALLALSD